MIRKTGNRMTEWKKITTIVKFTLILKAIIQYRDTNKVFLSFFAFNN
jgi:hypothetical protein